MTMSFDKVLFRLTVYSLIPRFVYSAVCRFFSINFLTPSPFMVKLRSISSKQIFHLCQQQPVLSLFNVVFTQYCFFVTYVTMSLQFYSNGQSTIKSIETAW